MGCMVGCIDRCDEGFGLGCVDGWSVSCAVGCAVGYVDDYDEGFSVSCTVGCSVA